MAKKAPTDILRIEAPIYDLPPQTKLETNTFFWFRVVKPRESTVEFDHKETGEHVVAPVVKFTLLPLDEEGGRVLPDKDPIHVTIWLPDPVRQDEEQILRSARSLKDVLMSLAVEISPNGEVDVSEFKDKEVYLRTRSYTGKDDVERIDVNWPPWRG